MAINKLTDAMIRKFPADARRYSDGGGLFLQVRDGDALELQLAHSIGRDSTEAAYNRATFLGERRRMMQRLRNVKSGEARADDAK
ncbi:hypothetical protein [Ferrovum sp.]|uniref:hypothetical protein n=1 Tax=Ferrovum sp. TaxID=2609467 RepID=UPI002626EE8F|nr:hypothetical protein [Ferrovum sp.]